MVDVYTSIRSEVYTSSGISIYFAPATTTMERNNDIPEYVSWRVVDAWLAIPPCNYSERPYCHVQCPYHYECYPEYYDDEDEGLWMTD